MGNFHCLHFSAFAIEPGAKPLPDLCWAWDTMDETVFFPPGVDVFIHCEGWHEDHLFQELSRARLGYVNVIISVLLR